MTYVELLQTNQEEWNKVFKTPGKRTKFSKLNQAIALINTYSNLQDCIKENPPLYHLVKKYGLLPMITIPLLREKPPKPPKKNESIEYVKNFIIRKKIHNLTNLQKRSRRLYKLIKKNGWVHNLKDVLRENHIQKKIIKQNYLINKHFSVMESVLLNIQKRNITSAKAFIKKNPKAFKAFYKTAYWETLIEAITRQSHEAYIKKCRKKTLRFQKKYNYEILGFSKAQKEGASGRINIYVYVKSTLNPHFIREFRLHALYQGAVPFGPLSLKRLKRQHQSNKDQLNQ